MAAEYLKPNELETVWSDAKKHMKPLFEPLDEYERIARNRPHPGIAKELPKVTDGTLATFIQDAPKRVIQQVPTGEVEANDPWLDIVGTYILSHEILPNANSTAALIQKCWALVSKSLTYGSQPAFVQFVNRGEYFGTDFTLPYIKDVFLEPGKLSDRDSYVIPLRAWYTPSQIDGIIAREKSLQKRAKDRGEDFEGNWDLKALANLKTEKAQKSEDAQTPNERNKADQTGYIEIVHFLQEGIGSNFYSWSPRTKEVVRTKANKDPRGVIPIHYMYTNIDLSNPLGRGVVEMTGGMQNLLDSEVQAYQYMRMLMMNPPIEKKGTFSKSVLKYLPNAIWDLGADQNASATPVKLESDSIRQFPQNYGLLKSQIQNTLGGNPGNDIPTSAGDTQSSKTPAGVNATTQRLGISDNYIRRQFEDAFQEICETKVNLYFAERSGTQDLTLDAITADKIKGMNPKAVNDKNQIRINYDTETPKLTFKVDPTSSNVKDDTEQAEHLKEVLAETSQDPLISWRMSQDGYKLNMGEAYRELYSLLGIKNINKIITTMSDQEKQQAQQAKMPMLDKPKLVVGYDDLGDNPEAQQQVLANAGIDLPVQVFQQALQMKQQMEAQQNAPTDSPADHPIGKVLAALQLKGTDFDPQTLRLLIQVLLRDFGVDAPASNAPLPMEVDMAAKAHDASLKADQQAHTQSMDATKTALEVAKAHHQTMQEAHQNDTALTDQALKIAQAHASDLQSKDSHALQVDQAQKSHELAQKQANKPVGATSGK